MPIGDSLHIGLNAVANNMLVPATGYAVTLLSNTPQNDHWKPAEVAVEMYNAASSDRNCHRSLSEFKLNTGFKIDA